MCRYRASHPLKHRIDHRFAAYPGGYNGRMTFHSRNFHAVVVGGGLVGKTAALALTQSGLRTALLATPANSTKARRFANRSCRRRAAVRPALQAMPCASRIASARAPPSYRPGRRQPRPRGNFESGKSCGHYSRGGISRFDAQHGVSTVDPRAPSVPGQSGTIWVCPARKTWPPAAQRNAALTHAAHAVSPVRRIP